jgi:hypothetical protein
MIEEHRKSNCAHVSSELGNTDIKVKVFFDPIADPSPLYGNSVARTGILIGSGYAELLHAEVEA